MQESRSHYWAFSASPRVYRIEEAIHDGIVDYWTVPNRDVRAGDRAIIWKAKGNGQQRGIIALAEVLTNPLPCTDPNIDYWVDPNAPKEIVDRVQVRYLVPPSLPLWLDEASPKVLRELSVARAAGGSVFHVTPDQWDAIMLAIRGWPAPEIEDAELAIAQVAGQSSSRQGFRVDIAVRRAIEQYAMQKAKAYYEKQGWIVTDVSSKRPYDLLCRTDAGEELHVEVKGTISDGTQIILTHNEVEHARNHYPKVALFVLAHIQVDQTSMESLQGGEKQILDPWNVDEGTLSSLAFTYILPKKDIQHTQ